MKIPLTAEQTAEIRAASDKPRLSTVANRIHGYAEDIAALENDGARNEWLFGNSEKTCECGDPMLRWESLNGRCSKCLSLPANKMMMVEDTCPCGHPSFHGWHMSAAHPRTVLNRCAAYWQRETIRVRDKKTLEMVTVEFRVSQEDNKRLEVVRVEREDYGQ